MLKDPKNHKKFRQNLKPTKKSKKKKKSFLPVMKMKAGYLK